MKGIPLEQLPSLQPLQHPETIDFGPGCCHRHHQVTVRNSMAWRFGTSKSQPPWTIISPFGHDWNFTNRLKNKKHLLKQVGFHQPSWKNMRQSKLEISNRSENTKYLSCHHLDLDFCLLILSSHHPNRNRFWPTWTTLPNIRFSVLRISRHWVAPVAIITASFLLQRSPQLLLEFLPEFSSDTPVASYCPLWKLRPKATIVLGKKLIGSTFISPLFSGSLL